MTFVVVANYRPGPHGEEIVDETDHKWEAIKLVHEYRMAYGPECSVYYRTKLPKDDQED